MTKHHGHLYNEKRDKPRLDSVKAAVALVMETLAGETWRSTTELHPFVEFYRPCKEDTVRRMIGHLIQEGTETHTFHRRDSISNPGTAEYCARRKPC